MEENKEQSQQKGYGKKPKWQWVLIYLVIGGLIYFAIYYLFLSGGSIPNLGY